jgi:phosphate transport system substrate-binding protein
MTLRIRTLAALAIGMIGAASLVAQALQINGAGATFPYPIYSKWFSEYTKVNPKAQINYQAQESNS